MPQYYPVFLNLEGRRCVVIGAGHVAERKVQGLLDAGAQVTVISPDFTDALAQLGREGRITMLQRRYQPGDLKDAFLAIAATDDPAVQKDVVQEASNQRLPLNVVDVPLFCSFIAPSVVRRGNITFAISTSGTSPALARWLREEVEQHFPPELAEMGEVVASVREEIRQRGVSAPAELWNLALKDPTFLALVRSSRRKDARAFLVNRLSAERR